MDPFKFKLEGLLKLRHFTEEKIKYQLGEIVQELTKLKSEIVQLKKDISVGFESQENMLKEATNGKMLQFYSYYIQGKREHIKYRQNLIANLEVQREKKVRELEKAMGDSKIVENLKEKKLTEFKMEVNKKQEEAREELAIMKGNKILRET